MQLRRRRRRRCAKRRRRSSRLGHGCLSIQLEDEKQRRSVALGVRWCRVHSRTAEASHQRYILLSIHHVSNGRPHAGAAGLKLKQLVALIGAVRQQPSVIDYLEDQVTRRRHHAAADPTAARRAPNQLLSRGIPSLEHSTFLAQRLRTDEG